VAISPGRQRDQALIIPSHPSGSLPSATQWASQPGRIPMKIRSRRLGCHARDVRVAHLVKA